MLHLVAAISEADVEVALTLLLDAGALSSFDAVRKLYRSFQPAFDVGSYDGHLPLQHHLEDASGPL